ncbi:hypothetical protein A2899_02590 [Candidatus Amesbacteria bacterium RIFCSPLOWO2_01_FULL_49_25]|uniref:Bacterial toxin RNase RnlA/LsoA DBD domain-containing protein n=1 Tax=Candidatus Amesbacteria bacterium RIFCSPHIGHO2_01_FULL_48_32b TaxID=1797253 RepID=A0A1F4YFH1_9BACT|nr:MAG: hypothetical protein A2876_01310 [Candidatus Amesbacteria bacterium RIFCSPHIGHO2_01_FULL_48_32b]OGD08620.1 MAG: hypothetical protein A2899_02590 [Candidatus Amesbacteria bacterium RIFCSPLOWO2_01_FULL_49_25]
MESYRETNWWKYLEEPMQDLVKESFLLLERERGSRDGWHDYSFVVFPMAKAYEGFLKKLFLDLKLISRQQYFGEHFRIGRALNPNLPKRYRSGWVYGKLVDYCGSEDLPLTLWGVWKKARNQIFHFFPDHHQFISLGQASRLIDELGGVMEQALRGCRLA